MSEHSVSRFQMSRNNPLWQGQGGLWRGFLQIIWGALRIWLALQLWGTAVRLAHFPPPTKNLGVAVAIITLILLGWGLWGFWQALTTLGIRRLLLTLLTVYLLFLAINVLTIPDDRPVLTRFFSQAGRTAVSFGDTAVSAMKDIFAAPDEFLFAYSGERKMPELPPGFPTPDPEATSISMVSAVGNGTQRNLRPTPTATLTPEVEIVEGEVEIQTAVPSVATDTPKTVLPSTTSTPQPASETSTSAEPADLVVGGYAIVVNTGGQALLARTEAGREQEIVTRFPEGTELRVLEGPVEVDGLNWWKVRGDSGEGWCADRWLRSVDN